MNIEIDGDYRVVTFDNGSQVRELISAQPERPEFFSSAITQLAFRNRFTPAQRIAMDLASIDNPSGTQQERATQAAFRDMLAELNSSSYVQLDRADLLPKLQQLEAAGILGAGDAEAICTAVVGSVEITSAERQLYGLPMVPTPEELALNGGKGRLSPRDI